MFGPWKRIADLEAEVERLRLENEQLKFDAAMADLCRQLEPLLALIEELPEPTFDAPPAGFVAVIGEA